MLYDVLQPQNRENKNSWTPRNHEVFFYRTSILETIVFWVHYNDLTATTLGMMVSKGNHPNMALIQVREIL
jgi:hypothetical protein